jgi:hypothetical protein
MCHHRQYWCSLIGVVLVAFILLGCIGPSSLHGESITATAIAQAPTMPMTATAKDILPSPTPLLLTTAPTSTSTPTVIPMATHAPTPTNTTVPTGGLIAFVSNRDGNNGIYVMDSSGSWHKKLYSQTNFLYRWGAEYRLSWSPDRQHIAFISTRDGIGNDEIYLLEISG